MLITILFMLFSSVLTPFGVNQQDGTAATHDLQVEIWRPVVAQYFEADQVDTALRVMACESGGNPDAKNKHSSASGLFQHLSKYWPSRAAAAGFPGASVFDPEANIAASAWLQQNHGWYHWSCY